MRDQAYRRNVLYFYLKFHPTPSWGKRYLMTFVQINIQYYLWLISPASIRRVAHSLTLLGELSTKNNINNLALKRKTINWLSEVHAFQCLYDRRFTLSVMKHIISWILWIAILKPQGLRQTGSSLHLSFRNGQSRVIILQVYVRNDEAWKNR